MQLHGESRRLPIYIVIDVSGSMSGAPIEAVNNGLRDFEATLKSDPRTLETAHISVITFESSARQLIPLIEAGRFAAPHLNSLGGTALGQALNLLGECLERELKPKGEDHPGDWKPLIFLMTDGEPTDSWEEPAYEFRNRFASRMGHFIAIGCGPSVNKATLVKMTETVLMMPEVTPETIRDLFNWISQSAKVASASVGLHALTQGAGDQSEEIPRPPDGVKVTAASQRFRWE